jgi:hypothetical protein
VGLRDLFEGELYLYLPCFVFRGVVSIPIGKQTFGAHACSSWGCVVVVVAVAVAAAVE